MSSNTPKFYRWQRSFWRQEKIKSLIQKGPTVFMVASYLLTSPRGNMAGLYECPKSSIQKALCLSEDEVSQAMTTLMQMSFIKYDDDSEYVWVLSQAEDELGGNPSVKQIVGVLNLVERLEMDELAPFTDDLRSLILGNPAYHEKLELRKQLKESGAV